MFRILITISLTLALLCSCATQQIPAETKPVLSPRPLNESELDQALQHIATESLGEREGAVLVIDPQNGRLRAVVNPRLAFEQTFPPGSAIKPFTALAALRAGLIDREFRHQCRTRYAREGFEIVCSHPVSKSPFNLPQALAYSCNNFFARVGERLSEGAFNSTLGGFGFGEKTGVNANESSGELPRGDWGVRDALGESDHLLVTPIQLMAAYAALVNGGHLYRPQRSTDHNLIPQEKLRLNIAPEHRAMLIEGMRGSVKYGTASKAGLGSLSLYVFGKTGTSTSSVRWRTQGWFVGFAAEKSPVGPPRAEQVKLGVLVFLKNAHGSQAAEIAKPIFECGMRNAECGMKKNALDTVPGAVATGSSREESVSIYPVATAPGTVPQAQPTIKIRSVSENVTRELPLEEYLVGVLAGESSVENEIEALKAQAVISRTFALKNLGRHAQDGYDFCSTTHCQRFVFPKTKGAPNSAARRAVEETAGIILLDPSRGASGASGGSGASGARQIVDAYFHAACGGMTANIETLWGAPAPVYLRGVRDDFCATMPHRRWTQKIPTDQLAKALRSDERTNAGARLDSITVTKRDATGRAEMVTIEGARRRVVRGWDFKLIVGRSLGWQMIKSSRFEVSRAGNDFVFRGSGFGHGLGLCQEGAHGAAQRGMSYRQILNHYFPGTRLARAGADRFESSRFQIPPMGVGGSFKPSLQAAVSLSNPSNGSWGIVQAQPLWAGISAAPVGLSQPPIRIGLDQKLVKQAQGGWALTIPQLPLGGFEKEKSLRCRLDLNDPPTAVGGIQRAPKSSLSSEHFRALYPANADARSIETALRTLETARADLLRRLEAASLRLAEPGPFEVVIHATTADFMVATGQSGWAAGATRGRRIELQPLGLLRRRGVFTETLRHELTHAVIEVLSAGRAPRWMAEGLAIYVAGEAATLPQIENKSRLSREELERKLARPASVAEARNLYAMAYHEIRAMIEADGEAGVWRRVARLKETSIGDQRPRGEFVYESTGPRGGGGERESFGAGSIKISFNRRIDRI